MGAPNTLTYWQHLPAECKWCGSATSREWPDGAHYCDLDCYSTYHDIDPASIDYAEYGGARFVLDRGRYGPAGWYLDCDTALCADCALRVFGPGGEEWSGFEDWPEPQPIMSGDESDSPTHCEECRGVIDHNLTADGYAYVVEAVCDAVRGDRRNNPAVLVEWFDQWGQYFEDDDRREIADAAIDRLRRDAGVAE